MKIFDKIKNILFEEEEIPTITEKELDVAPAKEKEIEPIEIHKEEIDLPKKRALDPIITEEKTDSDIFKSPKSFNFPMDVEDDFESIDLRKKPNVVETKKENSWNANKYNVYTEVPKKPEKAPFKASPIISPVYGVMDKNYKKEDILIKSSPQPNPVKQRGIDLDNARKKAYGTLEDEIETTLDKPLQSFYDSKTNLEDEPVKTIDDLLIDSMIDEDNQKEEVDRSFEEKSLNETFKLDEVIGEMKKASAELESAEDEDLFNLIDSMYSNEEEEDK